MKETLYSTGVLILALFAGFPTGHAALPLPEPEVAVSVNDSRETEIFRGMPLLVSVTLLHPTPFEAAAPILIAGVTAPWTTAVQLDVNDEAGAGVSWPFHAMPTLSNTVVLNSTQFVQVHRWLTPQETLTLSPGKYFVTATLNTTNVTLPGAWNGFGESVPAEVALVNEPVTLSEAQAENKYSQLALYELFLNNGAAALNHINQLLGLFPTNITAMRIKSVVLDKLGRTAEALAVSEQALAEVYRRNPNLPEPPLNLLELQRQLEAKLTPAVLAVVTANQQLSVSWFGHADLSYRLETSADLVNWSPLTTNFVTVGHTFSSTIPLSPGRRFLRVVR